ncbi:rhomboid family intramembrane serine protease [Amphibiibacter pelophylacis]|uniref:Rhomboid family intramembrane serine protease n=1 Tax=Amphibiibacter pelophylacis TaxID=1799477 RepID=A0ACC6P3E8_9BURK
MPPIPPVTKALMLICTALFCLTLLVPGAGAVGAWLALWPVNSGLFWPWQVVTYGFLHASLGHLFFNMLGLWMFGGELERIWGGRRYTHFLLASTLTAALAQLLLSFSVGMSAPTVGASGALYGLLMAFGMLFPNRMIMPLFPPIPMKAKYFVMVFGALALLSGVAGGGDGIAHFAHLGGMLGGFLMIRFWRGQPPFPRRRR